jgi:anti-anti-sigma factor
MQIELRRVHDVAVVTVLGTITGGNGKRLFEAFVDWLCRQEAEAYVLNLEWTTSLDAFGIETIRAIRGLLGMAHGEPLLAVAAPTDYVQRLLRVAGLTDQIPCFPAEDDALHYLLCRRMVPGAHEASRAASAA